MTPVEIHMVSVLGVCFLVAFVFGLIRSVIPMQGSNRLESFVFSFILAFAGTLLTIVGIACVYVLITQGMFL